MNEIIIERPKEDRIEVYPFLGALNANKTRSGIKDTAIILSNEEAERLRQALNKRERTREEKGRFRIN